MSDPNCLDNIHGNAGTLDEPEPCVSCKMLTRRLEGELCYPLCLDCWITAARELAAWGRELAAGGGNGARPARVAG